MDDAAIAPEQAAGSTAGFRICIDCLPDGTFAVVSEPLAEAGSGGAISDFGAALKQALTLYQNQGDDGQGAFEEGLASPSEPNPMVSAR